MRAIFSDDSDDEEDTPTTNQMEDPQKKTEAASAAFSRIVAGDFLESLGKELGLEVPPDSTPVTAKAGTSVAHEETTQDSRGMNITAKDFPSSAASDGIAVQEALVRKPSSPVIDNKDQAQEQSPIKRKDVNNNVKLEKGHRQDKKDKHELRSSSSEDERSKKRSRKHHRRHTRSSDDDDSDESRDRHKSRSRDDKRRSSRKKHRRRKHSRH